MSLSPASILWDIHCWEFGAARAATWTLSLYPSDSGAHAPTLFPPHPFPGSLLLSPSPVLPPHSVLGPWASTWLRRGLGPKRLTLPRTSLQDFPAPSYTTIFLSTVPPSATHLTPSPSPSASSYPKVHKHSPVFPILQRKPSPVLFLLQATTSSFSFISPPNFLGQKGFYVSFPASAPMNDLVIGQTWISALTLPVGYSVTLSKLQHLSEPQLPLL